MLYLQSQPYLPILQNEVYGKHTTSKNFAYFSKLQPIVSFLPHLWSLLVISQAPAEVNLL